MPVRLLNSAVHKWPDEKAVVAALNGWSGAVAASNPEVIRIGYIGSYARGDWGHGSDLDVIVVFDTDVSKPTLTESTATIPVPVDLLCYKREQFDRLRAGDSRFATVLRDETQWVFIR